MLSVLFAFWYLCPSLEVNSQSASEFLQHTTSSSNLIQGKLDSEVLKMSGNKARAAELTGRDMCVRDSALVKIIDNYDRPNSSFCTGSYSGAGTFENDFEHKPGKRIAKAGVYAAAGVGYARTEEGVFDAEIKGPNASAGVGVSVASGARAFAGAELASTSVTAGPVKAKVGLGVETGVGVGLSGVEVKMLGTGVSIGPKLGVSLFGSSLEFDLW